VLAFTWSDELYWLLGAAEFVAVGGAMVYLAYHQRRLIAPLGLTLSPPAIKGLVREGAPIGAGAVCWAATQFVPLFAIGTMAGMAQTGYFGAAHRLGVSLITFSWLYHFNLFPTLAGQRDVERGFDTDMVRASVRLTAWCGIALALGLTLAADALLPLLFGPAFAQAALPFAIIVWTLPLTLVSGHARWLLVASRRSGEMLLSQLAGVAAAVATSLALIPLLGTVGAAIGMTAAALAVWIASQVLAARKGTPVPWRPCILPMLAAAAILAAAQWTRAVPWVEAIAGVALLAAAGLLLDARLRATLRALAHGHLQQEAKGNG
jgi:O-antigen/teichoic acid export membrane protein